MPQTDNKRQLYAAAASIYSAVPAKKYLATSLLDQMTITPLGQWISPFLDADAAADSLSMPAHALLQLLHGDACFIVHQHGSTAPAPAGPAHLNPTSTRISLNPSALLTTSRGTAAPWTSPGYAGGMTAAVRPAGEQLASAVGGALAEMQYYGEVCYSVMGRFVTVDTFTAERYSPHEMESTPKP